MHRERDFTSEASYVKAISQKKSAYKNEVEINALFLHLPLVL